MYRLYIWCVIIIQGNKLDEENERVLSIRRYTTIYSTTTVGFFELIGLSSRAYNSREGWCDATFVVHSRSATPIEPAMLAHNH